MKKREGGKKKSETQESRGISREIPSQAENETWTRVPSITTNPQTQEAAGRKYIKEGFTIQGETWKGFT